MLMNALGFVVHDVVAHPFYGALSILGLIFPFCSHLAESLHDLTVFRCNEVNEIWSEPPRGSAT